MLSHTRSTSLQHRLQWRIAEAQRERAVSIFRDFCDFRDSRAFRNNDLVDG
jgi:hypothetical protein